MNEQKPNFFTREDLQRFVSKSRKVAADTLNKVREKIKEETNPNTWFKRLLKAKYDSLRAAGFNEKRARELALELVKKELDEIYRPSEADAQVQGEKPKNSGLGGFLRNFTKK